MSTAAGATSPAPANPQSIRTALRRRILHDVIDKTVRKHGNGGKMLLVVDMTTSRILSSCMRVNDLVHHGILAIENITKVREPLLSYSAIYFLATSPYSINCLVKDFSPTKEQSTYQMYKTAHVFLTSSIPDGLMQQIESAPRLVSNLGTLQEINIDFTTIEERVFTIASPLRIPIYYWGNRDILEYRLKQDSFKLVSLFLTLNDCPVVRYDSSSKLATKFASLFHKDLTSIVKNSTWEPATNGCVVIVDRMVDVITPIMHEYTYQSLVYDVCGNNNGEIVYINNETYDINATEIEQEKQQLILNDTEDALWQQHRHQHIGIVAAQLTSELKSFKKSNKMAQWEDKKVKHEQNDIQLSAKDMAAALRDFNQYTKLVSKFSKHVEITRECLTKVETRKLKEIAQLEQELSTGYDAEGNKITTKDSVRMLKSLCQNRHVGIEEKLRLVLLFVLTHGELSQSVIDQLIGPCDPHISQAIYNIDRLLPSDNQIFTNLQQTSGNTGNATYTPTPYSSVRRREGEARSEKIQFLRYVPLLWELGHLFVLNKLSENKFKYCDPSQRFNPQVAMNSSGSASGSNAKPLGKRGQQVLGHQSSSEPVNTTPYLVLFVLGGITFSEAKSIYEIANEHQVNIILGGSEMLTPRTFLSNLGNCTQEDWIQYCGTSNLSGVRQNGNPQQHFTTTFDDIVLTAPKIIDSKGNLKQISEAQVVSCAGRSLLDIEKVRLAAAEATPIDESDFAPEGVEKPAPLAIQKAAIIVQQKQEEEKKKKRSFWRKLDYFTGGASSSDDDDEQIPLPY